MFAVSGGYGHRCSARAHGQISMGVFPVDDVAGMFCYRTAIGWEGCFFPEILPRVLMTERNAIQRLKEKKMQMYCTHSLDTFVKL